MIDVQEVERRRLAGESLRAIADDLGVTHQTLQYHRRRAGLAPLRTGYATGSTHPSWRGGRFIDRFGYTQVLAPENGRANKYVPEHILVAEAQIGRRLRSNEVVHHINGVRADNRAENLVVMTRVKHNAAHGELEAIALKLVEDGAVVYEGGHYRLIRD